MKFVLDEPEEPDSPRELTLGMVIHNLTEFANFYEQLTRAIDFADQFSQIRLRGERDANTDIVQRNFKAVVGMDKLRAHCFANYGKELTINTARQFLGEVIRVCGLSLEKADSLKLQDALAKLHEAMNAKSDKGDEVTQRLLAVYTNNVSDEKFRQVIGIVQDTELTVSHKLTKINKLMSIPASASAQSLADFLDVSKTAVLRSEWWEQNRKGEKQSEIGTRQDRLLDRGKSYEHIRNEDEE